MAQSRRGLLSLAVSGLAGSLTGCSGPEGSAVGITPAPVPSADPAPSPRSTSPPPPSADELGFGVGVIGGFTEEAPARLEIALRNAGDRRLTVLDGSVDAVPFVDDDHVGIDPAGPAKLLLVPAGSDLLVEPPAGPARPIGTSLPEEPDADGCWTLPFEWPEDRVDPTASLSALSLAPGEVRRHRYRLYFLRDCAAGTYRFEDTFQVAAGDPPLETGLVRAGTAFEVSVSASMEVGVAVGEPVLDPPPG